MLTEDGLWDEITTMYRPELPLPADDSPMQDHPVGPATDTADDIDLLPEGFVIPNGKWERNQHDYPAMPEPGTTHWV